MRKIQTSLFSFILSITIMQAQVYKLLGTTSEGGVDYSGTIYSLDGNGQNFSSDYHFKSNIEIVLDLTKASDGNYYGIAAGGEFDMGTFVRYDSSTNKFTTLYSVKPSDQVLLRDNKLVEYGSGIFYMTGLYDKIYSFNLTTNQFTVEAGINLNLYNQAGGLCLASNGLLYGVGLSVGANNAGVVYEFNPITKAVRYIDYFTGANGAIGNSPSGALIQSSNGKLYGLTANGGTAIQPNYTANGTLYEIDIAADSINTLYTFESSIGYSAYGHQPHGSLYEASTGKLIGVNQTGGNDLEGTVFAYTISSNTMDDIFHFTDSIGTKPRGGIKELSPGIIGGVCSEKGLYNNGSAFIINTSSKSLVKLHHNQGSKEEGRVLLDLGNSTELFWLNEGGLQLYNTTSQQNTEIYAFGFKSKGAHPYVDLYVSNSGQILGSAFEGGSADKGIIFEYNAGQKEVYILNDLSNLIGVNSNIFSPQSGFTPSSNPNNLISYSKSTNAGFSINPGPQSISLYNTLSNQISYLQTINLSGKLIPVGADKYLGMDFGGTALNLGSIIEYDLNSNTISTKKTFSNSNEGFWPMGELVAYNNKYYGVLSGGGNNSSGVLIQYDYQTDSVQIMHHFIAASSGQNPNKLFKASNGKLYGTTTKGGLNNEGTFFEYSAGNGLIKIIDFDPLATGKDVNPSLMESHSGKIYGSFKKGGSMDYGTIFEYNPSGNTFAKIHDFTGLDGKYPKGGLMEVQSNGVNVSETNKRPNSNIFPNPSNGNYSLKLEHKKSVQLRIYSLTGQLVLQKTFQASSLINFDLDAPSGVYMLEIQTDGKTERHQLVKN